MVFNCGCYVTIAPIQFEVKGIYVNRAEEKKRENFILGV